MNGGGGQLYSFVSMMAVMFAIVYFLIIRPQQKQRQDRDRMLGTLKRGDRVVTTGGLFGTVVQVTDNTVTLRVADQVRLEFERGAVARVVEAQGDKDA